MNKYVVRTSLVWIALVAGIAGFYWYRTRAEKRPSTSYAGVQPLARASAPSEISEEAANAPTLAPVQLTPERLQSIGVKTAEVQQREITDHIRATGTVDINERLISYAQVRYSR